MVIEEVVMTIKESCIGNGYEWQGVLHDMERGMVWYCVPKGWTTKQYAIAVCLNWRRKLIGDV